MLEGFGKRLYMGGYQVVRADYFPSNERPAMTITNGKLRFNTACLKRFEDVEYVELLLNTVKNCIAIRPCEKDNPNAIHWGKLREDRWIVSTLSCRGLARTLFDMMSCINDFESVVYVKLLYDENLRFLSVTECDRNDKHGYVEIAGLTGVRKG